MSENQGQKRPAEHAPSPVRPNKTGRHSNDQVASATRDAAEYAAYLLDETAPFEKEDIDEVVGYLIKPPDDQWTQDQEDQVVERFRSLGMQDTRGRMTPTSNPVLLGLFKVCLRVFGVTPVKLISPLYQMSYQATGTKGKGKRSPHIFSTSFCDALSGLIVHPSIDASRDRLVCMLQFAIICRLDIRRPWRIVNPPKDCYVLVRLRREMEAAEGGSRMLNEPVSLIHKRLRTSAHSQRKKCSSLSDYLDRISDISAETYGTVSEPDDGSYNMFGVYYKPIIAEDLALVVRAIDETPLQSPDLTYSVSHALKSYRDAKKGHEFPSAREFPEVWERSQKNMLRVFSLIEKAKLAKSQENEAPAQNQEGSSGPGDVDMVNQEVDMSNQEVDMSNQEVDMSNQEVEEDVFDIPDPTAESGSVIQSSNIRSLTPLVTHDMHRRTGRLSDLMALSPVHGSSNPFSIRTREDNELSSRRAEEIKSLRELIQQLEDSRTQDREIISGLKEQNLEFRQELLAQRAHFAQELQNQKAHFVQELGKQGRENTQLLQRLEKQNMELIQDLRGQNNQFIKDLEKQNSNLFVHLQSSVSRGTAATVEHSTVEDPAPARSRERSLSKTQNDGGSLEETVEKSRSNTAEPEAPMATAAGVGENLDLEATLEDTPLDEDGIVDQEGDLPNRIMARTNLDIGYQRPQFTVPQMGKGFISGIGSMKARCRDNGIRTYNPLFKTSYVKKVEENNNKS
ncbi:hypothetical protein ACHAQD_006993 [Fusarium lateritium]